MSHIDGTMEFLLSSPLHYSKNGEFKQATRLEFYEYSGTHRKEYFQLRSMIAKVFMELSKLGQERRQDVSSNQPFLSKSEEDHENEQQVLYEAVQLGLELSDKVDIDTFVFTFQSMICNSKKPLCKIDGDVTLTVDHWCSLTPNNQLEAAIRYCSFFAIGLIGSITDGSSTSMTRPTAAKAH